MSLCYSFGKINVDCMVFRMHIGRNAWNKPHVRHRVFTVYKVMSYILEFHVVLQTSLSQAGTTRVCYTYRSFYFVYLLEPIRLFD